MRIAKNLFFMALTGCSTMSQTLESPVVLEKKKYAVGAGVVYNHNINQNDIDPEEKEEFTPVAFLGGRYSPLQNVEIAVAGGTLGLDSGSGMDLRVRYQWWGGWVDPFDEDFEEQQAKLDEEVVKKNHQKQQTKGKSKKEIKTLGESEDDPPLSKIKVASEDDIPDGYFDQVPFVPDGWVSTVSMGLYWDDENRLAADASNASAAATYLSNSVGYKKGAWVYYGGLKIIRLKNTYNYKSSRFLKDPEISREYLEVNHGLFLGVTYTRVSQKKHQYILDLMLSFTQLPKGSISEGEQYYPALTLAGWYVD